MHNDVGHGQTKAHTRTSSVFAWARACGGGAVVATRHSFVAMSDRFSGWGCAQGIRDVLAEEAGERALEVGRCVLGIVFVVLVDEVCVGPGAKSSPVGWQRRRSNRGFGEASGAVDEVLGVDNLRWVIVERITWKMWFASGRLST